MLKFRSYGAVIAVLLATAQAAFAGEMNPRLLVTTPALKPYADAILRGIGESQSLLRPGQDAHTFTLSPSQRRALAGADIILVPDRRMNPLLDRLLAAEEKRGAIVVVLTALKQANPLPYPETNPWLDRLASKPQEHEHEHDHSHADSDDAPDPHVWLDPMRMAALAVPVAEGIAQAAPSHRAALKANGARLAFHLREEVMPGIAAIFAEATPRASMHARPYVPFITYHAAYQYFLRRFGIEEYGEITQRPEDYLGAGTLHSTVAGAGKLSINCIISETNSPLVQRIAKASGARVVALSPEALYGPTEVPQRDWVRNDYDRLLLKTALSFAGCL